LIKLKNNIIIKAKEKGINPYLQPFKPSDLDLIASDYGSFSDYCSSDETISGKHNKNHILTVAERRSGKPHKYLLIES